jgi:hypothetical protein
MQGRLRNIYFSFPLQLMLLHIKKHHLILIFWAMLFLFVLRQNGGHYGIPLLFLDPEYLGMVNFVGFGIIGFALGGFIMAWNISFYILNSYRFEFLASVSKPFVRFCINNSIIPIAFIIAYTISIFNFQYSEGRTTNEIVWVVASMYGGILLMVLVTTIYFFFFNHDIDAFIGKLTDKAKEKLANRKISLSRLQTDHQPDASQWHVETYFVHPFKVRMVRDTAHYDRELVNTVLRQHHRTGFVIIMVSLVTLFSFGFLMEYPIFRIPAAAGLMLFFTVVMVLASLLTYWFRGWRIVAFVLLVVLMNMLTKYDLLDYRHRLPGLDYSKPPAAFDLEFLQQSSSETLLKKDIQLTLDILNKWHKQVTNKYGRRKPKVIFINAAGGGSKSSYWIMDVLQQVDSQMNGKLFDHTVLISGASGGMLGAAYFRELKLRALSDPDIDPYDPMYLNDIGKDLLNPMITSIVTNDFFIPWQKFTLDGQVYRKDRGFAFDMVFNENTRFMMDKPISAYREPEKDALIPMMILSPTIINDQRILIMSPQQVSYLTRPYIENSTGYLDYLAPDGIEFLPFFSDYGAENVKFTTALRMNASFPYIFPPVYLPSQPELKVMDAGIRENYGVSISSRFYNVFKNWIDEYTSGAIFLQLRTDSRFKEPADMKKSTFLGGLISPIGSIYSNFLQEQEYNNDHTIGFLENSGKTDISIISFAYRPLDKKEEAGMSIHLSEREKKELRSAMNLPENKEALRRLERLLR